MHGVTNFLLFGSFIINVLSLIIFYFLSKFLSTKPFEVADNLVTYAKFLGSGMKCDTSNPDYPKVGNGFLNLITTVFNTLFKPLSILLSDILDPFYSFFVCLIRSRIFNLVSLALMFGCT